MGPTKETQTLKKYSQRLSSINTRFAFIIPVGSAGALFIFMYYFTNYMEGMPPWVIWPVMFAVGVLVFIPALVKEVTPSLLRFLFVFIHCMGIFIVSFMLPFPTSFVAFYMVLNIITFINYGYRGMGAAIGLQIASLLARLFISDNQANTAAIYEVSIMLFAVISLSYFISLYLRIADDGLVNLKRVVESTNFEHERLSRLINSMADAVVATDAHARIVLYNASALNIFDTNKSLTNTNIDKICHLTDKNNKKIIFSDYITSIETQTINTDLRFVYPDESIINLYLSISPIRLGYGRGRDHGYIILMRDITREKSLEEERDEFISVVSHELRTPIAIAEGTVSNAEFLASKSKSKTMAPIKQAMEQAHEQILFLGSMINDLATLSRAERAKLKVEIESINAQDLVKELEKEYSPQAAKKGLKMKIDIDPKLEILKSGKLYVQEILQNFITNAIKYTEEGSVSLSAQQKDNGILFEVADTGIGIGKGDKEKVFDKFFRSEDYRTRAHNGTGLGLYVTMKLARLIQAEIDLESELDKGSTFSIFIPNLE